MSKLQNCCWTLVQHSAYAAKQDPVFRNAVEPADLTTHQQLGEVVDAGGLLFTSLPDAEEAADDASKPSLDQTLYPDRVSSVPPIELTFHEALTIGGRPLFIGGNS
ncbi:hypothetical protein [Streptomyces sp. MMBL 11-1]|uniref:hypothetical protein n=1 Tax=Streptomyces sp. MMBL 11-1 TaxID=3026420 RepID=UPI00235F1E91|nr:hypothetical protein [Streptomyces sp. MMBL 11-1]